MTLTRPSARAAALTALAVLALLLAVVDTAQGYPRTITVKQSGNQVTKSVYYRDYPSNRGYPVRKEFFSAGTLKVRAVPYRIKEDMKKFDQWLLHLDVTRVDRRGADVIGWSTIFVQPTKQGKVTDSAATQGRSLSSCTIANLSLNLGFGPIGSSSDIGTIKGCRTSRLRLNSHSTTTGATGWGLTGLHRMDRVELELYIQVPAGRKPNYRVTIERPIDSCTGDRLLPPSQCMPRGAEATLAFLVRGQT